MKDSVDYRKRIFDLYASRAQNNVKDFDSAASQKWGRAYDYFLRQWLPGDKNAKILDVTCGGGACCIFSSKEDT
jgi:2-polyprenyl-3-methyl-5-hydroxy-6-metoxy-1,4-benzoquinol methylase